MKLSTVLFVAQSASAIGSQPDGSALLQLRKLSVLSANNVSRNGLPMYGSCDRDELATTIEDLENQKQLQQSSVDGKRSELALRVSLVAGQKTTIQNQQNALTKSKTTLAERQSEETEIATAIGLTTQNLTSFKAQRVEKAKALQNAEAAFLAAKNAEKEIFSTLMTAGMSWNTKNQAYIAQKTVVAAAKTCVSNAKTALDEGETAASEQCATAANLRADATAAASEHAAAEAQLKTATATYDAAVEARDQRRDELRTASRKLDDANAVRAAAVVEKLKQCKQASAADLAENSAEAKYVAKSKICQALEAEEQELIKLQTAAQNGYEAASREASAACGANGLAEKALAKAQAAYNAASKKLADAKRCQASALAKETAECAKATDAHEILLASKAELVEAEADLRSAKYADDTATNALTLAIGQQTMKCDAADKAKCAMNKAKALLDAAKERFDAATVKREAQDEVVKVKEADLASLKAKVEEAQAKVTAAEAHHKETAKSKAIAYAKKIAASLLLKGKKWKVSIAVIGQGRAKSNYDTAVNQHACVSRRYKAAVLAFEKAGAQLAEKEKTKNICEEDVEATKEPERAGELLKKLQIAYDAVEISLGVWKKAKSTMDDLKAELDAKTVVMQKMEAEWVKKVKITKSFVAERVQAQGALDKASAEYAAACKANSDAYDRMVALQKELEMLVNAYNAAVDCRNNAAQVQADLVSAEMSAKTKYEFALEYWKKKVSDHDAKKGECEAAAAAREAAAAKQEGTASALASAMAKVMSIESRLTIETSTWTTAQSHCSSASSDRAEHDALVVQAENAQSYAQTVLNQATAKAKQTAETKKQAFAAKAAAKLKLEKAVAAATKKTSESVKCDAEEEALRQAWVKADAKAEKEQKQCAAACAALTAANGALDTAQAAHDAAFADHENACNLVTSTEEAKDKAVCAEASAKEDAEAAAELAAANEKQCSKLTADAETLKSEWEAAVTNLNEQEASASQMEAAVDAAKAALDDALAARMDALRATGAASAAVMVAQDALDAVDVCIDKLEKDLAGLKNDLVQAELAVSSAEEVVAAQEAQIADAQSVLSGYESDVTRVRQELESAEAALAKLLKNLIDADSALDSCPEARCLAPAEPPANYNGLRPLPNFVNGATWTPVCERGFKVEFCNSDSDCGADATEMTCTDGVFSPPSFRCAPILSGSLVVQILEGRGLEFGEGRFGVSTGFMFHAVPSDPFVSVEACPGSSNPETQTTSIKKDSYDAVWSDEPPLHFRIDQACNTFRVAVKDDRTDDENLSCMKAQEYLGGVDKLTIVEGEPLESFMSAPNVEQQRRIISRTGGTVDFTYTWKPDDEGPTYY